MDYFMYSTNEESQTLASATITLGYFIKYNFFNARETCHSFCCVFIDVFCIMKNKDF